MPIRTDFRIFCSARPRWWTRGRRLTGAALVCLGFVVASPWASQIRCHGGERWTTLDGTRTVEADFIGLWGNEVVLELPDARRVSVDVDLLIAESRIQARRMAEEQDRRRAESRQEIAAAAKEAAAPAPNPLPKPPSAPAYQPAPASASLMDQLEWMDQQNRNGHGLLAAFDSLPPSHQSDLERLVRASVAKLDVAAMNQVLASVHSIGDLLVTRQRWVFSHPRLGAIDDAAQDTLKTSLLSIGGLIRDGLDPEQLQLEQIQSIALRDWLVGLDGRVAPHLAVINDQLEQMGMSSAAYEVKDEKDDKASVEMTSGELKQTVNFVSVDGKWIPEESAGEKWTEAMKSWEDGISGTADGSVLTGGMAQMVPMMIDPIIAPAKSAQSAREFHAAMDGWLAMAAPLVAQLESFNPTRRGGGGGYGGYDDEMEMEMMDGYEEEMMMMEEEMGR